VGTVDAVVHHCIELELKGTGVDLLRCLAVYLFHHHFCLKQSRFEGFLLLGGIVLLELVL
jgi:hypothetical protein